MGSNATGRRRWVGGLALLAAAAMLIGGETIFKGRFNAMTFIVYWLTCFLLTGTAIVIALVGVRALQRRRRDEEGDLVQIAVKQMVARARDERLVRRKSDENC